ncbi:S-adenosyl-L-methionine-dependent methyltransferase [Xylariaceae sp. FL0804]|nr:S-adenosyl-L-methionine-dependent methyltransferase [Xylariaceae sp. FL0804]
MAQQEEPRSLSKHFQTASPAAYSARWNDCWDAGWTPWDRGGGSPALHDLLLRDWQLQQGAGDSPAADGRSAASRARRVAFACGDFLDDEWRRAEGVPEVFDLIFDYTFFCALPPSLRPAWGRRMRELLAPDGGRLVCLEFPSEKDPGEPGPPWAAPPHAYVEHLSSLSSTGGGGGGKGGLRRLAHFKPPRTHPAGAKNGGIQDCVSVWAH